MAETCSTEDLAGRPSASGRFAVRLDAIGCACDALAMRLRCACDALAMRWPVKDTLMFCGRQADMQRGDGNGQGAGSHDIGTSNKHRTRQGLHFKGTRDL